MELWQLFGALHPKLVQFPLVLLPLGLLLDAAGLLRHSKRAFWAGKLLTTLGTLVLLIAFICGIYAEIWAGRAGIPQHPIELHELVANIASWGFVILLAWRLFLSPQNRKLFSAYVAIGLTWYVLLALTAWLGGQLVFQYGAAVTGAVGNNVLTLDDLNTLAARQTDENLLYSEMMHHIFGWITLALSLSLIIQALFPKHAGKVKWISPLLFLGGGIFLFCCADLDLYHFTDPRQWRDREVLLHKSISLILFIAGATGLWKSFKSSRPNTAQPAQSSLSRKLNQVDAEHPLSFQSRIVAVMALIGGSMLFTHVHTVAPYANVAAGVYVAHVVMGLVALSIGATQLAQDYWPNFKRPLAVAFACFMGVEALLLLTYNEGLPRYIGYGRYNRWGSYSGTVAPYGPFRTELVVDQESGEVHIFVFDRFTDSPLRASFPEKESPTLLISRGYQEIAIPLVPVHPTVAGPARLADSHFVGHADFLKQTPAFSATLQLAAEKDTTARTGYFDPWVTRAIVPIPPNEVAFYRCPMHEGVRTQQPGACPLCQMELLPIDRALRPFDQLHDPKYALDLALTITPAASPKSVQLKFTPRKDNQPNLPLANVHTQPLHLIVVSADLQYFDHVHPVPQPDGSLTLNYTFPRDGRYLLFADITPQGDRNQIFRLPLNVSGNTVQLATDHWPLTPLVADPALAKIIAAIPAGKTPQDSAAHDPVATAVTTAPVTHFPVFNDRTVNKPVNPVLVQLIPQPRTLYAGLHSHLLFRLADADGKPLTDLAPYIGAMGHCVIISEDTGLFLHSHPEQLKTPDPRDRGGPDIAFHTTFPKPGRYKIFAQFRRSPASPTDPGQLIIADFTLDVSASPIPANLIRFFLDEQ